MSSTVKCDRYNSYIPSKNNSFIISTAYEGIPQNIFINILAYIVLISLFLFLRKKAWNYGNLAWLSKPLNIEEVTPRKESRSTPTDSVINESDYAPLRDKNNNNNSFKNKLVNYIPIFIRLSDDNLKNRCGSDAVIYCRFQRILMLIVMVMMFFSLTTIVPLNLHGELLSSNSSSFSTLTIANVPKESPFLWVHFTVALGLMLFTFFISTQFLNSIDIKSKEEPSFTVMIRNKIPVELCDEVIIAQHFREAYPSVNVKKVQVAFEVKKMIELYTQKVAAEEALKFCYEELENNDLHVKVISACCGRVCLDNTCCQGKKFKAVDGIEFYREEVKRLTDLFLAEKTLAVLYKKLPIFFVTFDNLEQALRVRRDYMFQNYCCVNQTMKGQSSLSKQLNSDSWKVTFAPMPKDIIWQNIHIRSWMWWVPIILMNLLIVILIIILSTPAVALNILKNIKFDERLEKLNNPLFAQFTASLVMVLMSTMMPFIVYWSDQLSAHWTKTSQNLAVMNKLFGVLVLTVLILPSLGLNSIPELLNWMFVHNNTVTPSVIRWECIFMPDGGALFCNYIITASFIGTALEFLRLGELFMYTVKRSCSRSRAEDNAIIKSVLWDFQFGVGYAWTLALFTVISAYSVIVPIITPFGLTYLLLKHLVDRYNMIYVNVPSVVHNSVHCNAAQLMQVGLVLTQATVTVYVALRRGTTDTLSICCFLAFVLGLLLICGRTLKRWIFSLSLIKYSKISKYTDRTNILRSMSVDLDNIDEDGFIMVDEVKNSVFVPPEMTKLEDNVFHKQQEDEVSPTKAEQDDIDTVPLKSRNYGAVIPNTN